MYICVCTVCVYGCACVCDSVYRRARALHTRPYNHTKTHTHRHHGPLIVRPDCVDARARESAVRACACACAVDCPAHTQSPNRSAQAQIAGHDYPLLPPPPPSHHHHVCSVFLFTRLLFVSLVDSVNSRFIVHSHTHTYKRYD